MICAKDQHQSLKIEKMAGGILANKRVFVDLFGTKFNIMRMRQKEVSWEYEKLATANLVAPITAKPNINKLLKLLLTKNAVKNLLKK